MKTKNQQLIEEFESQLAILKDAGEIQGYVFAVLPIANHPQIAANATTLEIFGLAEAIKQHHINQSSSDR